LILMRAMMVSTSSAAAAAAATAGYYFTYLLNATAPNTLYVPLTSRCNARTLPMTRGPNFALPPLVVAALCRVRNAEHNHGQQQQQQQQPQQPDNDDDVVSPQKLPEYPYEFISNIATTSITAISSTTTTANNDTATSRSCSTEELTTGRPTVDELLAEIVSAITSTTNNTSNVIIKSIVIGGEGEPLLRYNTLLLLIRKIKQHFRNTNNSVIDNNNNSSTTKKMTTTTKIPIKIRLTTNGLVDPSHAVACTRQLYDAGLDAVSVTLMTHDAKQYQNLMQPLDIPLLPLLTTNTTTTITKIPPSQLISNNIMTQPPPLPCHLDWVCQFCRAAIQAGLQVELTAINRPDIVDKTATERLAAQLLMSSLPQGAAAKTGSSDDDTTTTTTTTGPAASPPPPPILVRWRPYFP
jgi:hypothetical protein